MRSHRGSSIRGAAACAVLLVGCASGPGPGNPAAAAGLAVLPLRPLEAAVEDASLMDAKLVAALEAGEPGYEVADRGRLEAILARERVRVIESLAPETARVLAEAAGGVPVVTGTLLFSRERPEPTAAVLLRVYDASGGRRGSLLWHASSTDTEDILGDPEAAELLELFGLGAEDLRARLPAVLRADLRTRGQAGDDDRVAVLPFFPAPGSPDSGRLADAVTAHLLEAEFGFQVVELGDLLAFFRRARVREFSTIGVEGLTRLGREVEARWIVSGAVLEIDHGEGAASPPQVVLALNLFDATEGRTVAGCCISRNGGDGEIVLEQGLTPHPVANLAVAVGRGLDEISEPWNSR